ncbi:hypothetical protein [Phyllobacterium sophorae]|uniref:Uncharacterized protein n=1 Tax=Phyllobacterium sophorae TaxID=1520277 RepID=A0A2P7BFM6_9HYPH|nr:hypothetical protein [Phyllobacterium sophorae]PSH65301.1 hypothetical protein CU103_09880 [Phyllobacterium sophorae]
MPVYPKVKVDLTQSTDYPLAMLSKVLVKLREANVPSSMIEQIGSEALSGDYEKVLTTCRKYVDIGR